jgi:hypothetical protein
MRLCNASLQAARRGGVVAAGDKRTGTRTRLDQSGSLQVAVDLADRHRGHADAFGQFANRWQQLARHQFAAGDAVFDQPLQLRAAAPAGRDQPRIPFSQFRSSVPNVYNRLTPSNRAYKPVLARSPH